MLLKWKLWGKNDVLFDFGDDFWRRLFLSVGFLYALPACPASVPCLLAMHVWSRKIHTGWKNLQKYFSSFPEKSHWNFLLTKYFKTWGALTDKVLQDLSCRFFPEALDTSIKAWAVDFSRATGNFYWQSTPMLAIKIFPLTLEFSMVNIPPTLICRFFQGHWKFLPTKYSKDWAVDFSSLVGNFYKCIEHFLYIISKNYWVKCLSTYVQQYMHYKLTTGGSSVISFNIHSSKLGALDISIKAWAVDFSRATGNFYWQSTPMLAIKIFPLTLEFSMVNIPPTLICRFFQGHWKFLPTKYSKDWAVDFSSLVGNFYKCIEHFLYIISKNYWVKCLSTYVQQYMHYKLTTGGSSVISFNIHSSKLSFPFSS